MKYPIRFIILLAIVSLFSGCISGWINRGTARGREVLKPGTSEAEISKCFGAPLASVPESLSYEIQRGMRADEPSKVWKVKGRPAQADDGSGEATVSAMTLGLGEVFLIPMSIANAGVKATQTYFLIGYFSADGKLLHHKAVKEKK